MTDFDRRRVLAVLGTTATAVLGGCNRLVTRPDSDGTPEATSSPVPRQTETETTPTSTESATTTASAAPTDAVAVPSYDLSLDHLPAEGVTTADVRLDVRNVSGRPLRLIEIRVDLIYHPSDENRAVAVDYVGTRGLSEGETETLRYETTYPNDGRANGSTDPGEFGLEFRVREVVFG